MTDLGKTLAKLAGAFFAHQAKKHLGDRFLVTLGQELVGYVGETTSEKLTTFFAQGEKPEQLIAAFSDANSCFAQKCEDPELKQCILALPLQAIPTLENLASLLPQTLDDEGLLAALRTQFRKDWPNLGDAQVDRGATIYFECLSHALAAKFDQLDVWSYLETHEVHRELRELRVILVGSGQPDGAANKRSDLDVRDYAKWVDAVYQRMKSEVLLEVEENVTYPEILTMVSRATSVIEQSDNPSTNLSGPVCLFDVATRYKQFVLLGEPGTGKTVGLWQLASRYCHFIRLESTDKSNQDLIPVIVDCVGNSQGEIENIIQRSLRLAGQDMTIESIAALAREGRWALLLDDYDLIKSDLQPDITLRLRNWSETYSHCQVVVVSHRPVDGHILGMATFRVQPLRYDRARQILLDLPNIGSEGALAIMHGLPEDSRHLVTSPLTLRMLAYAYLHAGRAVPRSRGLLYREVVGGMLTLSEKKGQIQVDRSEKVLLLARLARWALDNETYAISPAKLSSLISLWIGASDDSDLRHLGSTNQLRLRAELLNSGLLRTRLDGDIEFIHNTFLAYFAALTIRGSELASLLKTTIWHTSITLWASLYNRIQTDKLIDLLGSRPVLLGKIISERADARRQQPASPPDIKAYFDRFYFSLISLIRQFNCLLHGAPGASLDPERLGLIVARAQSNDYMVAWHEIESGNGATRWVSTKELIQRLSTEIAIMPLPVTLIKSALTDYYHPAELAYLWITRALYEWLRTGTWNGGVNVAEISGNMEIHPAAGLVINRFLLYHALASGLPAEFSEQLNFYAYKNFDLAVEVDLNAKPPRIRYGIAEAHEPARMSAICSTIKGTTNDRPLLRKDDRGNWWYRVGQEERQAEAFGDIEFADAMSQASDTWARSQIFAELERRLPGFPPAVL